MAMSSLKNQDVQNTKLGGSDIMVAISIFYIQIMI